MVPACFRKSIGRSSAVLTCVVLAGCWAGRQDQESGCTMPGSCLSGTGSGVFPGASTNEAGEAAHGSPGRLVETVMESELDGDSTGAVSQNRLAEDTAEDGSDDFWRQWIESQQSDEGRSDEVGEPPSRQLPGAQGIGDGLFESLGLQPDSLDEVLSLTLDGMLLDTLDESANIMTLGSPLEEIPGRFPTYLELLCREEGYSDSYCRQRYGY